MAVDIFYEKLSYEEIEQNVAFEFLSLLSEIGGFLGLLLGCVCSHCLRTHRFRYLSNYQQIKKETDDCAFVLTGNALMTP